MPQRHAGENGRDFQKRVGGNSGKKRGGDARGCGKRQHMVQRRGNQAMWWNVNNRNRLISLIRTSFEKAKAKAKLSSLISVLLFGAGGREESPATQCSWKTGEAYGREKNEHMIWTVKLHQLHKWWNILPESLPNKTFLKNVKTAFSSSRPTGFLQTPHHSTRLLLPLPTTQDPSTWDPPPFTAHLLDSVPHHLLSSHCLCSEPWGRHCYARYEDIKAPLTFNLQALSECLAPPGSFIPTLKTVHSLLKPP